MSLGRSCVDPAKRLHIFQVWVLWTLVWQCDVLIATDLRHENDGPDLLDLWILRRANTIHVASDLDAQICNANEALENVLGKDISVANLLQVIRIDVDVVSAQVHIGGRDRTHSPVCLRCKLLALVL